MFLRELLQSSEVELALLDDKVGDILYSYEPNSQICQIFTNRCTLVLAEEDRRVICEENNYINGFMQDYIEVKQ